MKILVIDQVDLISPALAQSHYEVEWVEDDVQAYHLAQHQQPAIIFLGYELKKSDTPEFVAFLLGVCPNAKVIILGEQLNEDSLIECLVAGAQGYQQRETLARYAQRLILAVSTGEAWLSRKMVAKLLNVIRTLARAPSTLC